MKARSPSRRWGRAACAMLGAALLLPAGCSKGVSEPKRIAFALFDISQSTSGSSAGVNSANDCPLQVTSDIRCRYFATFKDQVLTNFAADGGVVKADIIDSNPLAHASQPIDVTYPAVGTFDNPIVAQKKADDITTAVTTQAGQMLADQPQTTPGTDLFGAFQLAADALARYPTAQSKYIIVFSDMVQRTNTLQFGKADLSSPEAIAALIQTQRDSGPLPDLRGVGVYVVGAGVTEGDAISATQIADMETFWKAYLQACGAQVVEYGPTLNLFP